MLRMPEEKRIVSEIEAVLMDGGRTDRADLEYTLTSGYAAALALEAEHRRLGRQLAAALRDDTTRAAAGLVKRREAVEARSARLRSLLDLLRVRAREARAA